ncbi:hypothetical protein D6D01_06711 [Aureobasidium pullulans]|uniref:Uncharacterized protein n=1 Tax=Aureobasidium pullulans TaxID=5580 RepID=A0A4S9KX02_AURPU|nr:hypothetical protein D6D01_06711 [Aureobasidium pullulans]
MSGINSAGSAYRGLYCIRIRMTATNAPTLHCSFSRQLLQLAISCRWPLQTPSCTGSSAVEFGTAHRRSYHTERLAVPTDELVSHDRPRSTSPEVQAAIEGNWTDLFKGRTTPRPNDVETDKGRLSG